MKHLTVTAIRKTYHKCCTIFCVKVQNKNKKQKQNECERADKTKKKETKRRI